MGDTEIGIESDLINKTDSEVKPDSSLPQSDDQTQHELDNIEKDLEAVLTNLDNFMQEDDTEEEDNEDSDDDDEHLSQSELLKDYITEGDTPSVNWDNLGPFVQNIVGDLNLLRNLNNQTNDVVKRIRKLTKLNSVGVEQDDVSVSNDC